MRLTLSETKTEKPAHIHPELCRILLDTTQNERLGILFLCFIANDMSGNYGVSRQERNDEVTDAIDHHYLDYPVKRERPDIDNDGIRSNNKKQKVSALSMTPESAILYPPCAH